MKVSLSPWTRLFLALSLLASAIAAGWAEFHPEPRAVLELVLKNPAPAKVALAVNRGAKVPRGVRERLWLRFPGAEFVQLQRVPLTVQVLRSFLLEAPRGETLNLEVLSIRLLDSRGKELWKGEGGVATWDLGSNLVLGKKPARTQPRLWAIWVAVAVGLTGLLLVARSSRFLRQMEPRPLAYFAGMAFAFGATGAAYWGVVQSQRGVQGLSDTWVHHTLLRKQLLAEKAPLPKTMVFGGSSGLYGVDASLLSRESGTAVVNYAFHAGSPLAFHLDLARNSAVPGDSVILHLEYSYWGTRELSEWVVAQELGWGYRRKGPRFVAASPLSLMTRVPPDRLLAGAICQAIPRAFAPAAPVPIEVPGHGQDWFYPGLDIALNQHGDLRFDLLPNSPIKVVPTAYVHSGHFKTEDRSVRRLGDFAREMKGKGIHVYFAFPATIRSDLSDFRSPEIRPWVDGVIKWVQYLDCVPLGRPEDFALPLESFYDTVYHLNEAGRERHTRNLLHHLRASGWPRRTP